MGQMTNHKNKKKFKKKKKKKALRKQLKISTPSEEWTNQTVTKIGKVIPRKSENRQGKQDIPKAYCNASSGNNK